VVLLAGILLRALPGRSLSFVDAPVPPQGALARSVPPPEATALARVIRGFYTDLNAGRYRQAFERAREASWSRDLRLDTNRNIEDNRIVSFTPLETLVARTREELGERGERLNVFDVVVDSVTTLSNEADYDQYQDVRLLSKVDRFQPIEKVYVAHVSGQIFATFCAHATWEKLLVVIRFRGESRLRIFLNGAGNLVGSRAREWFLDRKVGEYLM
jgi:hypothetical protein